MEEEIISSGFRNKIFIRTFGLYLVIFFLLSWIIAFYADIGFWTVKITKSQYDWPNQRQLLLLDSDYNLVDKNDKAEKVQLYKDLMIAKAIGTSIIVFIFTFPAYLYVSKKYPLKYLPCPNKECDKSIKIWTNWKCDHCHEIQNKEHYIIDKCHQCKRELKTVFCEHCHKEIIL